MARSRESGAKAATAKSQRLGEAGVVGVLRLASRINLEVAALLKPYGLTPSQYNALRILRGAGEGWATRQRDSTDRRVVTTRITAPGIELLASLDAAVATFGRGLFARIDDERLGSLVEILGEVLGE
jgi:DNA-binding MarR family transcriptional regulator